MGLWLEGEMEAAFLRRRRELPVAKVPGFDLRRGHFVPERDSSAAREFLASLLEERLLEETDTVYERMKNFWGWKRRELKRDGLKIVSPMAEFRIEYGFAPDRPAEVRLDRIFHWRAPAEAFARECNAVFPEAFEDWVLPLRQQPDFASIVDSFELLAERHGGNVRENERLGQASYSAPPPFACTLSIAEFELVASPDSNREGCYGLLRFAQQLRSFFPAEKL